VNGAVSLLNTLQTNGVDVCFANPGTSEMHFVAALDDVPGVRGVLCLFEGVATGAADGYARVTGKPATTLLHLGPGLGNGFANLHNARRARVPLINIVGDHATFHEQHDAPLQSDIAAISSAVSGWHRKTKRPDDVANDVRDAILASYGPPAQIATLVLAADASWGTLASTPASWPLALRPALREPDSGDVEAATKALRGENVALFLGGDALGREGLELASRVSQATGARVITETFPTITDRGAGIAAPERLIYLSEFAVSQLKDVATLIVIGSREPVGFFGYPDIPSRLVREDCTVLTLAEPGTDAVTALRILVDEFQAPAFASAKGERPSAPTGPLTTFSLAQAIGATMPEDVIVADESNTGGVHLYGATQFCPPHQWMTLTGGAIGFGLPAALGASVGGGGRRVLAVEADGSLMYTPQALWTMAREGADVTVVALSNRSYAILNLELQRVGAVAEGTASMRMLDLEGPSLNLAAMASGQGVPSSTVSTADELVEALQRSYATPGPTFIEAVLPKGLS
jgi:acetolactate synthase-1/2/3 large subunit